MSIEAVLENLIARAPCCMKVSEHVNYSLLDGRVVIFGSFVIFALDKCARASVVQVYILNALNRYAPMFRGFEQPNDRLVELVKIAFYGCCSAAICHGQSCKLFNLASEKGDRKGVVLGKSVSVRVDLGGSSIIKKKKNKDKDI